MFKDLLENLGVLIGKLASVMILLAVLAIVFLFFHDWLYNLIHWRNY